MTVFTWTEIPIVSKASSVHISDHFYSFRSAVSTDDRGFFPLVFYLALDLGHRLESFWCRIKARPSWSMGTIIISPEICLLTNISLKSSKYEGPTIIMTTFISLNEIIPNQTFFCQTHTLEFRTKPNQNHHIQELLACKHDFWKVLFEMERLWKEHKQCIQRHQRRQRVLWYYHCMRWQSAPST